MGSVITEVVVDAVDPDRLAAFWCDVLGWRRTETYDGVVEIADPDWRPPTLVFVPVDEAKRAKNRIRVG